MNPKLGADKETAGPVPVPLRVTVCGLSVALSVKLNVAPRLPTPDGSNLTLTAQVALGASEAPVQLSAVAAKSPGLVPAMVTEVIASVPSPVLVTVSVCAGLRVPCKRLPKSSVGADKPAAGPVPVPVKLTAWGLSGALSEKLSVAVRLPMPVGVNVTLTVHEELGRIAAELQVSADLAKSPAFAPAMVTVVKLRSRIPVLVTVIVWEALAVPAAWCAKVRLLEESRAPTCAWPPLDDPPPPQATPLTRANKTIAKRIETREWRKARPPESP